MCVFNYDFNEILMSYKGKVQHIVRIKCRRNYPGLQSRRHSLKDESLRQKTILEKKKISFLTEGESCPKTGKRQGDVQGGWNIMRKGERRTQWSWRTD